MKVHVLIVMGAIVLTGCTHTVKVEPIKVEPIDITLHIYLEADKKLDDFFGDVEKAPKAGEDQNKDLQNKGVK